MKDEHKKVVLRGCQELLGIRLNKRLPTHYELLGLPAKLTDSELIEQTAKEQSKKLLEADVPDDLDLASILLQQAIDRARICLSDPNAQASYLEMLREKASSGGASNTKPKTSNQPPTNSAVPPIQPSHKRSSQKVSANSQSKQRSKPASQVVLKHGDYGTKAKKKSWLSNKNLTIGGSGAAILLLFLFLTLALWESNPSDEISSSSPSNLASASVQLVPDYEGKNASGRGNVGSEEEIATTETAGKAQQIDKGATTAISAVPARSAYNLPELDEEKEIGIKSEVTKPLLPPTRELESSFAAIEPQEIIEPGNEDDKKVESTSNSTFGQEKPLEFLLTAVSLPSLEAVSTSLKSSSTEGQLITLGKIPEEHIDQVTLLIDQPKVRRVTRARFEIRELSDSSNPSWEVMLVAVNPQKNMLSKEFEERVALIRYEGGELRFEWLEPKYMSVANTLRNCALHVAHPSQNVPIVLRDVTTADRFVLDLTESSTKYVLPGEELPSVKGMKMQLMDANLGGVSFHTDPPEGVVGYNEELDLVLENTELESLIRISLEGGKDGNEPYLSISQRFKFGKRWKGLNDATISKSLEGLRKSIQRNKVQLSRAKSDLPRLEGELKSVNSKIPRTDGAKQLALISSSQRLATKIRATKSRIKRLASQIPESEVLASQVQGLAQTCLKIQGNADLGIRVFVPTEQGEYDLLKTAEAGTRASSGNQSAFSNGSKY